MAKKKRFVVLVERTFEVEIESVNAKTAIVDALEKLELLGDTDSSPDLAAEGIRYEQTQSILSPAKAGPEELERVGGAD